MYRVRKLDLRPPEYIAAEQAACQAWSAFVVSKQYNPAHAAVYVKFYGDSRKLQSALRRASHGMQEAAYNSYARLSLTNNTSVSSLTKCDMQYLGILNIARPHWWQRFLRRVAGCH